MKRFGLAIVLLAQCFWLPIHAQTSGDSIRTWQDHDGRKLSAEFLYFRKGLVGLRLASGREAAVGLETLSKEDQDYVFDHSAVDVFEFHPTVMPHHSKVNDADIQVTGGPNIYETRWFQFENQETISAEFVHKAAQIFEATRAAIHSLPLGLETLPPKGMNKFRAQFVTNENFKTFLQQSPEITSPDKIAGVYDQREKSVIVPYDQLGAKKADGRMTLHNSSDPSTLIHEITHQLMHDSLTLLPIWFSEGFAEYMSSIPYHDGTFEFEKASEGLKKRLLKRYGSLDVSVPRLKTLLDSVNNDWEGLTHDYASALIYTYYFMHLDQPEAPGSPLAAYLFLLNQAKTDTYRLISDYNDQVHLYNTQVIEYNQQIVNYRIQSSLYQSAVRDYNLRVDQFNQQLNQKDPPKTMIELGERPVAPILPVEPVMSDLLKGRKINSPIDLFQLANTRAQPSLLRARDYATIEAQMVIRFAKLGITVSF